MSLETTMLLALATPLAGSVGIALVGNRQANLREAVTLLTAVTLFALVASLFPAIMDGARPTLTLGEMLPGLPIQFTLEPLGMTFAGVASFLWIVNSLYSIGYMRANKEMNQTRFYVCFAIALASTIGVAFAGNMLTLFICYEVLTICTYPLVAHAGTDLAKRNARIYLGILLTTSIGLQLLAILGTWVYAGTLDFRDGGIMAGAVEGPVAAILLFLYMYGIGKAAIMPVHRWLPAAMVAPTPVSALLHAVAVVKAGVFTVLKVVVYLFGIDYLTEWVNSDWLFYVAGFTILAASTIALRQNNLKRMLAYSTVSQLSYVVMATAILAPLSIVGAALHIVAHAFGKITLFFAAGSIYTAAHKTEINQLDGIGRRMPWTMGAFAIGALSMIGIPPTAGFISKWYILNGAMDAGHMAAVAVIIISALLNAGYFLPIVYAAFFKKPSADKADDHGEAPWPMVVALTVTAAGTILLFLFPEVFIDLAQQLI
ncbi:MAG: monovalent cation/H+ antiporter subunit D family protein [Rhodospirillaceae bacterium]|nr:monovalent cation/H+ antiporter subunit D family protein [Rhodospirillaceae bacterium]MBT4219345.1 monovalent cation/H+ antiporter subunit D family protein [Rhodospirillaceae bacterium]MBT5014195.1 monovalent cation/H+ antiporter subunit D family protein [Rhodospirillaceae bacterium]MBT5308607.1 monovalent cation/H+ antiporter subunit D family protein [Rhodospirillaceae bacterium]MBT6406756.1 monovalent cation/H+ antiporter subunit D family protein [Rhodospirillaceae bacterium]